MSKSLNNMDNFFGKTYKLVSSDNFQEYMKALDVNGVLRKIANTFYPEIVLTRHENEYTLTSSLPFKNIIIKFEPGVEFDQETPDGRDVKSTITINGSTLHEVQKCENGQLTVLDRIFSDKEVKMQLKLQRWGTEKRHRSYEPMKDAEDEIVNLPEQVLQNKESENNKIVENRINTTDLKL